MSNDEYRDRRILQDKNWRVEKTDKIEFNSGSESREHFFAKAAVAWVLRERGYRVDSEVEMENGEVDIVAYGRPDGDMIAVEVETDPQEEVIEDKIERYVRNQPVRECFVLNVDEMGSSIDGMIEWAEENL